MNTDTAMILLLTDLRGQIDSLQGEAEALRAEIQRLTDALAETAATSP